MPGEPRSPVFYVESDGVQLTLPLRRPGERNVDARCISFRYEDCEKGDDLLELTISDPAMEIIEGELLHEGREVTVSWGYPGDMSEPRLCVVKEMAPEFESEVKVKVKAFDKGSNLREGQSSKTWTDTTHSAIAEEVAARHGLVPVVDPTDKVHEAVPQGNRTDFDFLQMLAERNGFAFWVEGAELHWGRKKQEKGARFVLSYRTGRHPNLVSFRPESSSKRGGGAQVRTEVKGFDLDGKAPVGAVASLDTPTDKTGGSNVLVSALTGEVEAQVDTATLPTEVEEQSVADDPDWMRQQSWQSTEAGEWPGTQAVSTCGTAEEAEAQARAAKGAGESKCWKARARTAGSPAYRAKEPFEVRGVGTKYSGLWWAVKVTHSIDSGGYTCEIDFDRQGGPVAKGKAKPTPGKAEECQSVADHFGDQELDEFAGGVSYMPQSSDVVTVDAETGQLL